MKMRAQVAVCVVVVSCSMSAHAWAAEESLSAARELYASASYDDALKMLDGLAVGTSGDDRDLAHLYRVMCLVALGRKADADRAIETLVSANPKFRPVAGDIAPRVQTAFRDARRRMLPAIIQRTYASSKAAFDRQEFADASRGFTDMLDALNDPDLGPAGGESPLSDLRMLATGFHDLSVKAIVPPPLPAAAASQAVAAIVMPKIDLARIYSSDDAKVVAPMVVRQDMPQLKMTITAPQRGVIDLVIDETGQVASAMMRVPLAAPVYNDFALSAARSWRYRPATLDGVPVKFRKAVTVNLTSN